MLKIKGTLQWGAFLFWSYVRGKLALRLEEVIRERAKENALDLTRALKRKNI